MVLISDSLSEARAPIGYRGFTTRIPAWPIAPLLVFGAARIIDALFLITAARRQIALGLRDAIHLEHPVHASPGYWAITAAWDGQWYKTIALHGYPRHLPEVGGIVQQNEWAFYPAFPLLARIAMSISGASFEVAASMISLVAGAAASVVLYGLVRRYGSSFVALGCVVMLNTFVAAPVLQMAYTESLALLLILLCLARLAEQRYAVVTMLGIAACFSRAIGPALALTLAAHYLMKRRSIQPFPRRDQVWNIIAVTTVGASSFVWPLVAGIVTGVPDAYLSTMRAWPSYNRGTFGWIGGLAADGAPLLAPLLLIALLAVGLWFPLRRAGTRLGLELRCWTIVYPSYVVLATSPASSILRYMLLAAPGWWPLLDVTPGRASRRRYVVMAAVALVGLLQQFLWTYHVVPVTGPLETESFP